LELVPFLGLPLFIYLFIYLLSIYLFFQKLETNLPETHNMTNAGCLALLMGDDPPQEIENLFYRFLTSLFRRRLGI